MGGYPQPCLTCDEPIIFDGRAWDRDGFPYPHECEITRYVPTEHDFCTVCGGYGQGSVCGDCQQLPVKQAVKVIAERRVARPQRQGLDL